MKLCWKKYKKRSSLIKLNSLLILSSWRWSIVASNKKKSRSSVGETMKEWHEEARRVKDRINYGKHQWRCEQERQRTSPKESKETWKETGGERLKETKEDSRPQSMSTSHRGWQNIVILDKKKTKLIFGHLLWRWAKVKYGSHSFRCCELNLILFVMKFHVIRGHTWLFTSSFCPRY